MTSKQVPAFQSLTGIFDPSAIQQLPDGRFLVVEDEKSHPLGLVAIGADGGVENPSAIFESDEAPRIAPLLDELDLGGHGIRGLSYVPAMGAYLVIGGPTSREPADFDLWRLSGSSSSATTETGRPDALPAISCLTGGNCRPQVDRHGTGA